MAERNKSTPKDIDNSPDKMMDASLQAAQFERVRTAQQTEKAEDYVEMIDDLINAYGEARIVELARRFGVSHATVNKIVKRLARDGLVHTRPYRSIFLTQEGHRLADASRKRHQIVLNFLRAIGVSERAAKLDAEGIEHYVSDETLAAFERIVEKSNK
jgi:DtxR family manganese transport transcriptional regulator